MSRHPKFAAKLKELREDSGFYTVAELGRQIIRLGYSQPSYFELRRYELGDSEPSASRLAILVDALGLSQREAMLLIRSAQPMRSPLRPERKPREKI